MEKSQVDVEEFLKIKCSCGEKYSNKDRAEHFKNVKHRCAVCGEDVDKSYGFARVLCINCV